MSTTVDTAEQDRFEARVAVQATGLVRDFNEIGVLSAADVQVALRLAELVGEADEAVRLAVALAVRGPRLGNVFVDLRTIRQTASVESDEPVDLSALAWPEPGGWIQAVAASELVAVGEEDPGPARPLRLLGARLYLDRYWREERSVASDLGALATDGSERRIRARARGRTWPPVPGDADRRQRDAAAAAVRRRFAVVAGGPGTGKTTTVARIVALLAEQARARGERIPLVALGGADGQGGGATPGGRARGERRGWT